MANRLKLSGVDARVVNDLPVDQLGLMILDDFISSGQWNDQSYIAFLRQERPDADKVVSAVMEGIAWLFARGLVMRDALQAAAGAFRVTRQGRRVHDEGPEYFHASERLQVGLHPEIERVARPQFLIGHYEMAVFAAMKAVEVRVRSLGQHDEADVGVKLINLAFSPKGGTLTDPNQDGGEQEGTRALFAGAYAVFRNPSGHREVDFDDVTEAAEMVQTASLLMRMLDRVDERLNP